MKATSPARPRRRRVSARAPSSVGLWCLLLLLHAPLAAAGGSGWIAALDERVVAAANGYSGELSLYVGDVVNGDAYGFGADEPTYLSSTIKLVVAVTVLSEVDAGVITLDEQLVYGEDDVRDGVGPLRRVDPGAHFTVAQLLELMLVHSDNAAADLLIGRVGVGRLNDELRERGLDFGPLLSLYEERLRIYGLVDAAGAHLRPDQIRALGEHDALSARAHALTEMLDRETPIRGEALGRAFLSFYDTGFNAAPMRQMGLLLEQLARCEGLSEASCAKLRAWMAECRTGTKRIRAGLPPAETWRWGHKTGTQYLRACDVGILYPSPDRPVVVAACTRDFQSVAETERLLAELGRAVWEAFGRSAPGPGPTEKPGTETTANR